jgi:hypothetical protein
MTDSDQTRVIGAVKDVLSSQIAEKPRLENSLVY